MENIAHTTDKSSDTKNKECALKNVISSDVRPLHRHRFPLIAVSPNNAA